MSDSRAHKRTLAERKNPSLVWRKGRFSPDEIASVKSAVGEWARTDSGLPTGDALEQLLWAKDNGLKAWGVIALKSGLIFRKIEAIRACALRHCLTRKSERRWTQEETETFRMLQNAHGQRAWKAIAKEMGKTVEEVQNKGRAMQSRVVHSAALRDAEASNESCRADTEPRAKKSRKSGLVYQTKLKDFEPADFDLVAAIKSLSSFGVMVHDVPWSEVATLVGGLKEVLRHRWLTIFNRVIASLTSDEGPLSDSQIDRAILFNMKRAVNGKLSDFPAVDFESMPWNKVCPFLPGSIAQSRARMLLRRAGATTEEEFETVLTRTAELCGVAESKSKGKELVKLCFNKVQEKLVEIAEGSTRRFDSVEAGDVPAILD